jgi:SAM-dependent methyltransferase
MTTWGAGEYRLMAERLVPAAEAAVRAAEVTANDRVLDVATGTGNAALVAAGLGAEVIAVDFEPALLAIAESRAIGSGVGVRWMYADAEALPVPDAWANVVVSVFGVMYAADHHVAARELARVAAPDARVVLASWMPDSVMPAMGGVLSPYLPPAPPSTGSPSRWGDPDALSGLLEPCGLTVVKSAPGRVVLGFPDVTDAVELLLSTAGHVVSERERLTAEGRWEGLRADLRALVQQRGEQSERRLELALEYLLALAVRAKARPGQRGGRGPSSPGGP